MYEHQSAEKSLRKQPQGGAERIDFAQSNDHNRLSDLFTLKRGDALRRRLWSTLGILAIGTAVIGGASITSASAASCAGQGDMFLNKSIGLPIIGAVTNVGFSLAVSCTLNDGSPAQGVATGNIASAACGRSTGGTGTIFGKPFVFQSVGTLFIVQGSDGSGVIGLFHAVPDPRYANNGCTTHTAHRFVVTSAFMGPW
jgi:hypothetical protein